MVSLYLDCIAADPTSTTLYGITTGSSYGSNDHSFLLIKSNSNLDHIDWNTWTVVSKSIAPYSDYSPAFKTVDCTVSTKGVFTAFIRNADYLTPGSVTVPVGVRYDPETQKWTSIRTSPYYGWTKDMWTHMSFYVNNGGVESLVHMFSDMWGTVIRFGVFNEAESVLQLASIWKQEPTGEYTSVDQIDKMPDDTFSLEDAYTGLGAFAEDRQSNQKKMIYADGHLYMMHYNHPENVTIDSFPFNNPITPPPATHQVFKGPAKFAPSYFFAGTRGNTTFLGGLGNHKQGRGNTTDTMMYDSFTMDVVEGVPQAPVAHKSRIRNDAMERIIDGWKSNVVSIHENFVTVGGQLQGQNPIVVGLASEGAYEFSIVGTTEFPPRGWVDVVIAAEFSGSHHYAQSWEEFLLRRKIEKDNKRELTDWEKFLIAVACFVGLYILVKYNNHRKAKNRAAAEAKHLLDQGLEMDRMRSAIADAAAARTATITGASTTTLMTYEDQIANLEFSRHPRPSCITSVDEGYTAPPYNSDNIQAPEYSQSLRPTAVTSVSGSNP
ncbi:hypothetical protein BKA57DRAFT_503871 [Linnemannia elongata]|nr:hypothetical protein BKA57DRAFT_503871 [Linnemannia elongata]